MGRDWVNIIEVHASVSRHNSEQDVTDDALVEELRERIQQIVDEPKYKEINASWM